MEMTELKLGNMKELAKALKDLLQDKPFTYTIKKTASLGRSLGRGDHLLGMLSSS